MKITSAERREARRKAEAQAVATAERFLAKAASDLVAERDGAGLSKKDCESMVERIQDVLEPGHWKAARQHLRKRLKELGAATGGQVYRPPPATYIRRDKSPLAGDAMTLVGELEALIERFLIDIREDLNAPEAESDAGDTADAQDSNDENSEDREKKELQKKKKREAFEKKKAQHERRQRLRTLGRITFSAIVNGGLLQQDLYRELLPKLCDGIQAREEFAWVTFPLDDANADEESNANELGAEFDEPVRRWIMDPLTLGLVTCWHATQTVEERRSAVARTKVQNALGHYIKYLRTLPSAKEELHTASVANPAALFRAATARISLYLPPVLVNFLRSTASGQSMSERTWWRFQFDRIITAPVSEKEAPDSTIGLTTVESRKARYKGDNAAFFGLQDSLLKVLHQCLGEPGNLKKADKNGPATKRIGTVLEKRKGDMAPLLYAFYSWVQWKLQRPSKKQGRIRCSSARRYTSRLGQALIALGAELSVDGMGSTDWECFYEEVIESLDSAIDRTKAIGNLRDFHRYLMIGFDAPPAAIDGEVDAKARTRSTLISEGDFQQLMEALGGDKQPGHQVQVLRIIATLMFRAGLRPNELIGLEYRHIQGAPLDRLAQGTAEPILYLHATSSEDLKTPSGVRQIPLSWFLSPREMQEFQGFLYARLSVYKDSNQRSAVILTPSLGVNTRISSKEYFGTLTELLREITGDPAVVAYTLRHSCISKIFRAMLEPRHRHQHPFSRNGLLPREATYALSTLAGHLDPDITLQSYIHTQDIVCHLHLRNQLKDLPIGVWAALEGRAATSLYQRRSRNSQPSGQTSERAEDDQILDTTKRLAKKLKLSIPKGKAARSRTFPGFEVAEASLLHFDIETIHALLSSFFRKHSRESRARLFGLPDAQIQKFKEMCLRLASYETVSTSGKLTLRNLKPLKNRKRLPALYRRAQPGLMGPAPPHHSRKEMSEANRIYRLLVQRARFMNMDRKRVIKEIIEPVRDLLLAYSGTEAVIRTVDGKQFSQAIEALRNLNIRPEDIELEIEALPHDGMPDVVTWFRYLCKIGGSRKLRQSSHNTEVNRRSLKYPEFGIVKIRVLEAANKKVGGFRHSTHEEFGDRAGVGWRVGSFYAIAALTAVLWSQ